MILQSLLSSVLPSGETSGAGHGAKSRRHDCSALGGWMKKCYQCVGWAVLAVVISASSARAQDQQQPQQTQPDQPQQTQPQQPQQPDQSGGEEQPIPAYKSPLASQADNGNTDANTPIQLLPDNAPLTGIQSLSLGVPLHRHSYWEPHAQFDATVDTNPPTNERSGLTLWSTIAGGVDLYRYSGNSEISFQYLGGGIFSNNDNAGGGGGILQDANLSVEFTSRRWSLILLDELRYSPENSFGGAGFEGISSPIGVGGGLGGQIGADQTILSAFGQRLTNSSDAEVNYLLSPNSSLTLVGGVSLLNFFDEPLLNSTEFNFEAGYNHKLNRSDSIGISYQFSAFRYDNFPQAININRVLVSYGKKITGRFAFKLSAGPEFAQFQTSISGTNGLTNEFTWSLYAEVLYALERTEIAANYRHGVVGGSGVLAGANGNELGAHVTHQISRTFTGSLNVGYARNSGLPIQLPGISSAPGTYDYWIAGAHLNHPIGRTLHVIVGYDAQYQNSNAPFCSGSNCGQSFFRNLFTVGLAWRTQPKAF
jgi:hypothetical protein